MPTLMVEPLLWLLVLISITAISCSTFYYDTYLRYYIREYFNLYFSCGLSVLLVFKGLLFLCVVTLLMYTFLDAG